MGKNELLLWGDAVEDEMLPLTLPPPLCVVDSSTSSHPQFSPWDSPSSQFHHPQGGSFFPDAILHFNSLLGSLPSLPSTTTTTSPATPPSVLIPLASHSRLHPPCLSPDPWFAKQAAKCQNVSTFAWVPAIPPPLPGNCDESSRAPPDGSSISEQVQGRRKCLDGGKAKEPPKFAEGGDDSVITTSKRSREDEDVEGVDLGPPKQPKLGNEEEEDEGRKKEKKKKEEKGGGGEGVGPPKDCIHVRARRGQATDSHSLAERVRREKISERMKILQDLVPSCSKVTGKALVLDEIINYVQSLQRQVEYLSMKLASVNTNMHYSMNTQIMSKDMFQSIKSTTTTTAAVHLPMLEPPLHDKMQECTNFKYSADPPLPDSRIPPLSGLDDQILAPFRSEDLHSFVEMGLFGQMNPRAFDRN